MTASACSMRGPLHPAAEVVAVAELLDLPGPQRLERVDREHAGHAPQLAWPGGRPCRCTRCGSGRRRHRACPWPSRAMRWNASSAPAKRGSVFCLASAQARIAADAQVRLVAVLVAEAAHLDRDQPRQRAAQVLDVDAGAAVDVRRVLVGEQRRLPDLRHRRAPLPLASRAPAPAPVSPAPCARRTPTSSRCSSRSAGSS